MPSTLIPVIVRGCAVALAVASACVSPVSHRAAQPAPRPRAQGRAPVARDAGALQVPASLPAADFSALLEGVGGQLAGQAPRGALWVQQPPTTQAELERVAERLTTVLQRRGRTTAGSATEAAAVVLLLPGAQVDAVDGQRSRTLALLALVVAPQTGELLAVRGSRETVRLGPHQGKATAHPTAAELLDLASDVGHELRRKLTQVGLSLPASVIVEAQPVRNRTGQAIQADLAALWILDAIGTVPRVRAVLGARQRQGMTPPTALLPSYVLKTDLSTSGGAGQDSRLTIQLKARLAPLVSTNAPVVDAEATLLPPLAPGGP